VVKVNCKVESLGNRICLPFTNSWVHPQFYGGVRIAYLFRFLCGVLFKFFFVFLGGVAVSLCLVPNIACVSGLFIPDFPFA
jgi:hypothetical protein